MSGGAETARSGKILVALAILLPVLVGFTGLVLDTSMMMAEHRNLQNAVDAGATAGAMTIYRGGTTADAIASATAAVKSDNGFSDAQVSVSIPPSSGPYAGQANYVEVVATRNPSTFFMQVLGGASSEQMQARSVAGSEAATAGTAVAVLDPNPAGTTVNLAPYVTLSVTLPPLQLGGLEVLGLGQLRVNGAVVVNNQWGGRDENGNPAGSSAGPPYGVSCTPLIGLTNLAARDIRVVGGVDNPNYYSSYSGGSRPLHCNKLAMPDPYATLSSPSLVTDPRNVSTVNRGSVNVISLPLIGLPTTLNPGVYDWIQVTSGRVTFNPGIYIIRSVNPLTQLALSVVAGQVTANGVLFYITDSSSYSATTGAPDSADGSQVPGSTGLIGLVPSVVIASLLGSSYSPLNDAGSPFNGLLIYQRRLDRRPIVIADESLILGGALSGAIYAKYAQAVLALNGTYDLKIAAGSVRFANLLECTLSPSQLMPPAMDVFLVQ